MRIQSEKTNPSLGQHVKRYLYTLVILGAVTIAMLYPQYFLSIGNFKLQRLIVPLLQIIMVGVGCTMGWQDIRNVLRMPKAVFLGVCFHYMIMPLIAFGIAHCFGFPPEIAAGVILVGCCPSGLASNVIALLSKANVPLSVSITTISTLLAPLMTPLLMKVLGGGLVPVSLQAMMIDMVKLVILPISVGMALNRLLKQRLAGVLRLMPLASMVGIAIIIVIITAAGRESLLHVGFGLIVAMALHMSLGAVFGYFGARLCGLPETDCRTISIEVGMQNGGLASGIAVQMGQIATMGLAAAVNGPVMNTFFSMLGTWWGNHPASVAMPGTNGPVESEKWNTEVSHGG